MARILPSLLLLAFCAAAAAQTPPPRDARALFACSPTPLLGGVRCRAPDAAASAAAAFAVQQINARNTIPGGPFTLGSITLYGTQVVAGTNIFLQLVLKNAAGQPVPVQAKVFRPLGVGALQLSQSVQLPPPQLPGGQAGPVAAPAAAGASPRRAPLFACAGPGQMAAGGIRCQMGPPSADARAAAALAVSQLSAQRLVGTAPLTLVSIDKWATQVVAGTNFFLELTVRDAAGATKRVQARVSQALPVYGGGMTLTGYQAL